MSILDLAYNTSGHIFSLPGGTLLCFTGFPGQIGVIVRAIAGTSCEIGGPSLTSGTGFLFTGSTIPDFKIPCAGNIYFLATGTTTATFSCLRLYSAGVTGAQG